MDLSLRALEPPSPFLSPRFLSNPDTRGMDGGRGCRGRHQPELVDQARKLYVDLQNQNYSFPSFGLATPRTVTLTNDNILRAGINYKFDWGSMVAK